MTSSERSASILPAMYFNPAETQHQADQWNKRNKMGMLPHLNPGSTLVAAMGAHWHPGSFEAVFEMVKHSSEEGGLLVHFYSEQDRCFEPYDGLGTMRNLAYMRAIRQGFEYVMYVDNDVLPEKDALIKLQAWNVPIIAPRLEFADGADHKFIQQHVERDKGLVMPPSLLLSMLLFKTDVFLPWAHLPFWDNARGSDEEYHFIRLAMIGHHPFIGTNTTVKVLSSPHFPFDAIKRNVSDLAPRDAGLAPITSDSEYWRAWD